jgi:spore maturation protein CgeB
MKEPLVTWLVVDTVYPAFTESVYASNPRLEFESYAMQLQALLDRRFGASDFYSRNLSSLGLEAQDVLLNVEPLQRAWLRENGSSSLAGRPVGTTWFARTLEAQIRRLGPEVVLLLDMAALPDGFLRHLSRIVPCMVGQVAAPLDFSRDFRPYSLVVTSLPPFVDRFASAGVRAELLPLAFEPTVRDLVPAVTRDIDLAFVGSLDRVHSSGTAMLSELASRVDLQVWAPRNQLAGLSHDLQRCYRGEAWGIDMYKVLARSKLVVNRHIGIAEGYANNLRLFEATGMGAALVTESAPNLGRLFEPAEEVVTYESGSDCAEQVVSLLSDEPTRVRIASAGQRRTLSEHTYAARVADLIELVGQVPRRVVHTPQRSWRSHAAELRERVTPRLRSARERVRRDAAVSSHHQRISAITAEHALARGWQDPTIALAQRVVVDDALASLAKGQDVIEFSVAADALRRVGAGPHRVLEVGCASGYYKEALESLGLQLAYTGVDYAPALLAQGKAHDPTLQLVVGDAAALPFSDDAVDVVLSGSVLLHMPNWQAGLAEACRVARSYVVLHRTPVTSAQTTFLSKRAYGVPVVEVVLNQEELMTELHRCGASVVATWVIDRHELSAVGAAVATMTYLVGLGARDA